MVDQGRRALCGIVLLAAALPLVGAAAAPPAPKTYTVIIDKMKFGPVPSGLHVGDTIVWVNRDLFRHTATARDKSFDIDLPAGKSGRMVLKHAGTVGFWCKFHPGMKGQLVVAP